MTWEEAVPTASATRSRRPFITGRSIHPVSVAMITTLDLPSERTSAVAVRSLSIDWTSPSRELKPKVRIPRGGLITRRAVPAKRSGMSRHTGTCGCMRSFVKMVSVRQSTRLQSNHVMYTNSMDRQPR